MQIEGMETIFIIILLAVVVFLLAVAKNSIPAKLVRRLFGGGNRTRMNKITNNFARLGVMTFVGAIIIGVALMGIFTLPFVGIPFTLDLIIDNAVLVISVVLGITIVFSFVLLKLTDMSTGRQYKRKYERMERFSNPFEKKKKRWRR